MLDLAPGHAVELTPNLKFAGTVNIDETTHGFADKVYDRAQLLELPLLKNYVEEYLDAEPYRDVILQIWTALRPIAPFGFRVLEEMHHYVVAAGEVGIAWEVALDEQLVQKVLPRVRGADASLDDALAAFLAALGEGFPLATGEGRADAPGLRDPWLRQLLLSPPPRRRWRSWTRSSAAPTGARVWRRCSCGCSRRTART